MYGRRVREIAIKLISYAELEIEMIKKGKTKKFLSKFNKNFLK